MVRAGGAVLLVACALASPAASANPPVGHVWVINLENSGICNVALTAPLSPATCRKVPTDFLSGTLFTEGTVVANYYGVGHESLDNYIAEVSGQAPNPATQDDCAAGSATGDFLPGVVDAPQGQAIGQGCVYPARVETIAGQLDARGLNWKGYEEDMGIRLLQEQGQRRCALFGGDTPVDSYVPKHDPFVWFHSIIDDRVHCEAHVAPLTELRGDLQRLDTTPSLSFITPNMTDDGHDSNFWSGWLAQYVPLIENSAAFRQDGMILVIFDEQGGTGALPTNNIACCGEIPGPNSPSPGVAGPGGGDTGAIVLSPDAEPGKITSANSYNHYSLLRSLEDIFGVTTGGTDGHGHLGYAAGDGLPDETVGFRAFGCDDIFTVSCPAMGSHVPFVPTVAPTNVGPRRADGSVRWLNPDPQGSDLNSVSCFGASRCVAVGAMGAVITTGDGSHWVTRASGTSAQLNAVSCTGSGELCVAAGSAGVVLRSTDGGATWSSADSGTSKDLNGVTCADTSTCYAVGGHGTILKSEDGAQTWTPQPSPTTFDLAGIACPTATVCYVSGDIEPDPNVVPPGTLEPDILASQDGGHSWSVHFTAGSDRARDIACSDATHCAAAGENGNLVTTTDGQTWGAKVPVERAAQNRTLGMSCLTGGACVGVGEGGIVETAPDGSTWHLNYMPSNADLSSVSCAAADDECYAVGPHGAVYKSADRGHTWTAVAANLTHSAVGLEQAGSENYVSGRTVGAADLQALSCTRPRACIAVGNLGAIVSSADGGSSWTLSSGSLDPSSSVGPASTAPAARSLHGVSCGSDSVCVAVGELGVIQRTTDGGASWSVVDSGTTDNLSGVDCPDASTCFAVGYYGTILQSTDGGASWLSEGSAAMRTFLNSISCADATHCVAGGSQGVIERTADGSTWSAANVPTTTYLSAVSCPDSSHCLAVGPAGTVLRSEDGGESWSLRTAPSADDLDAVACATGADCVATGSAGTVVSTSDAGESWTPQGTGTEDALHGVSCPTSGTCLAAGDYGAVLAIAPASHAQGGSTPPGGGSPGPGPGDGTGQPPEDAAEASLPDHAEAAPSPQRPTLTTCTRGQSLQTPRGLQRPGAIIGTAEVDRQGHGRLELILTVVRTTNMRIIVSFPGHRVSLPVKRLTSCRSYDIRLPRRAGRGELELTARSGHAYERRRLRY